MQMIEAEEKLKRLQGAYEAAEGTLQKAIHDRSKTTVYAPAKGFTPCISFDNEMSVDAYTPVMSFVSVTSSYAVAIFSQRALALVEEGDEVEFLLDIYPGHIFHGYVEKIVWGAGEAQICEGERIPKVDALEGPEQFVVKVLFDVEDEEFPVWFGSRGEAVVYTDHWKLFHIIQKVHLRMKSWLRYVAIPW